MNSYTDKSYPYFTDINEMCDNVLDSCESGNRRQICCILTPDVNLCAQTFKRIFDKCNVSYIELTPNNIDNFVKNRNRRTNVNDTEYVIINNFTDKDKFNYFFSLFLFHQLDKANLIFIGNLLVYNNSHKDQYAGMYDNLFLHSDLYIHKPSNGIAEQEVSNYKNNNFKMNTLNRDRNTLRKLVESYGKKDVTNYVRHLNENINEYIDSLTDDEYDDLINLIGFFCIDTYGDPTPGENDGFGDIETIEIKNNELIIYIDALGYDFEEDDEEDFRNNPNRYEVYLKLFPTKNKKIESIAKKLFNDAKKVRTIMRFRYSDYIKSYLNMHDDYYLNKYKTKPSILEFELPCNLELI